MRVAVYVPLAVSIILGVVAPCWSRRLPAAFGTRLVAVVTLVVALDAMVSAALLAAPWLAQLPLLAAAADWSPRALDRHIPVPDAVSVCALLFLVTGLVRLAVVGLRHLRAATQLARSVRGPNAQRGALVMIEDGVPDAYVIPVKPGRIVMTTGMMRILDTRERRVVLAHEAAHLRHRHHLYRAASTVSATVNPFLYAIPGVVRTLSERWADEVAGATIGDRRFAARVLAHAAFARTDATRAEAVNGIDGGDVPARVRALLAPVPRHRVVPATLLAMILTISTFAVVDAGNDADALFDAACVPVHSAACPTR